MPPLSSKGAMYVYNIWFMCYQNTRTRKTTNNRRHPLYPSRSDHVESCANPVIRLCRRYDLAIFRLQTTIIHEIVCVCVCLLLSKFNFILLCWGSSATNILLGKHIHSYIYNMHNERSSNIVSGHVCSSNWFANILMAYYNIYNVLFVVVLLLRAVV